MLTKEELKIIDLFRQDLFKSYTIRELMRKISKKSYNWTFKAVKKLNALNLIKIERKGKSSICRINLDNRLTLIYFALLEELNAGQKRFPKENIRELMDSIPLSYFTFIIGGSYATGKATKKSDLDIAVLVEDGINTKKLLTILRNKSELMVPEVHPYVFAKSEFLQMLLSEEANYGKLLFKSRLILFGAESYYLIIKEAIEHGFKG